jgi:hypothetical protein
MFILLTPSQADQVRGPTSPGAMLMPIEVQGGQFVLPMSVLSDPAHDMHHSYLAQLPQTDNVLWLVDAGL